MSAFAWIMLIMLWHASSRQGNVYLNKHSGLLVRVLTWSSLIHMPVCSMLSAIAQARSG